MIDASETRSVGQRFQPFFLLLDLHSAKIFRKVQKMVHPVIVYGNLSITALIF